jgi:hypothetical protein
LEQPLRKTGKSPVFLLNLRKLFQKLKFWNSLIYILETCERRTVLSPARFPEADMEAEKAVRIRVFAG